MGAQQPPLGRRSQQRPGWPARRVGLADVAEYALSGNILGFSTHRSHMQDTLSPAWRPNGVTIPPVDHHRRVAWPVAVAIIAAAVGAACSTPSAPTAPSPSTMTVAAVPDQPSPPPPPSPPDPPPAPTSVRYRIVFEGVWSQSTHPLDYPGNPHFSPRIGGTHSTAVRFWADGGIASDGIKRMAEQGFRHPSMRTSTTQSPPAPRAREFSGGASRCRRRRWRWSSTPTSRIPCRRSFR